MSGSEPLDPTVFGFDSRSALVVALIDGQISRQDGDRLKAWLESDSAFREEVERARCLRALVSTLPRVGPPAHVQAYTDRLAHLFAQRRANSGRSSLETVLGALPHRSAPAGIADAVLAQVRAARASRALADRRLSRRRAVMGIAATVLAGATGTLFSSRSARSKSGRRFSFEVVAVGLTGPTARAFGRSSFDSAPHGTGGRR